MPANNPQALFGFVEPAEAFEYKILTESKDPNTKVRSVTIRTPVQRLGKKNGNSRIYSIPLMTPHINGPVKELCENNHLVGEFGHPIAEYIAASSDDGAIKRIVDIDPKLISHAFNKIWLDGDLVMAEIRTLQGTKHGREMCDLIILDRINLGFSLRSIGQSETVDGVDYIKPYQFRFVTYDAVINPSNGSDAIMQPKDIILTESASIVKTPRIDLDINKPIQVCMGNRCALMEALSTSRMSQTQKGMFYKESLSMAIKNTKF